MVRSIREFLNPAVQQFPKLQVEEGTGNALWTRLEAASGTGVILGKILETPRRQDAS